MAAILSVISYMLGVIITEPHRCRRQKIVLRSYSLQIESVLLPILDLRAEVSSHKRKGCLAIL